VLLLQHSMAADEDFPSDPPVYMMRAHQQCIRYVLSSLPYKLFMGILNLLNCCLTIVVTDMTAQEGNQVPFIIELGLLSTLVFFSAEILCRIFVDGRLYFTSKFNIFDMCVVGLDVLVEVISQIAQSQIPSVSVLRVLRVVRLTRAVGYMTHVRELYLMLHGMASAMRTIVWAAVLIGMVIALFSVIAVELIHPLNRQIAATGEYDDCQRCPQAYSSVGSAFMTIVTSILAGDSWGRISIPIMEKYPASIPFFIAVLFSINLGLLNLILAVIVERAEEAREEDHQQRRREKDFFLAQCKKRLQKMFRALDRDGNNLLSKEEMHAGVSNNDDFADILHLMDLGEDDLNVVFAMMDSNKDGEIDLEEFIEQIFRMRCQDSQTLLLFIKHVVQEIRQKNIGNTLEEMKRAISEMASSLHCLAQCGGNRAVERLPIEPQLSVSMTEEISGHDCQWKLHMTAESEEPWREWQQWEVLQEELSILDSKDEIRNANMCVELESLKRQINEDFKGLGESARSLDEGRVSCNMAQHSSACTSNNIEVSIARENAAQMKEEGPLSTRRLGLKGQFQGEAYCPLPPVLPDQGLVRIFESPPSGCMASS